MNIDQEKLSAVVKYMMKVWGFEDASEQPETWDTDDLNTVIQELLGANISTPFELPAGAEAVAYYITDGNGDGFIFALRPDYRAARQSKFFWLQVATPYEEAKDYEPRDDNGDSFWDGGKISAESVVRQVAESVSAELETLVPAYNKLFRRCR